MNLEKRLRDRFSMASEALPGRPLDWTETYDRARRGRSIYVAAVAFATALLLIAGGFATLTVLTAPERDPAPLPPAQTEPARPTPSPSPTEESQEMEASHDEPYRAVDGFIQAAAEADAETMWSLMTEPSRAVYDHEFERFREALSPIEEGWGSWAAAKDVTRHWQVVVSSGDGAMGVVTLMGSRAPEGHEEPYSAAAIPVRVAGDGEARVELFVGEGAIEFVTPRDPNIKQPPTLDVLTTERPSFEALVPAASNEVEIVAAPVADEPAVSFSGSADLEDLAGGRARALWSPDERFFGAEWFLTVLAIYEDGSMQAQSVRFAIE